MCIVVGGKCVDYITPVEMEEVHKVVHCMQLGECVCVTQVDYVPPVEKEEARKVGTVSLSLYWKYLRRGIGIFGLIVFILLNLLAQATYIMSDWWLAHWLVQGDVPS